MPLSPADNSFTKPLHFLLPYAELMRIDKPVGILNIFFPYFYGFAFATLTAQPTPAFSDIFPWKLWHLFFSAFLLRSMGCAWNDLVDMDLDRLVERTKTRPLARGAISLSVAYCFTAGLLVIWSASLIPLIPQTVGPSSYVVPLITLVLIYPYMKRITDYAQVVLGVTLGFGILFGAAFGGIDILHIIARTTVDTMNAKNAIPLMNTFRDSRVVGLLFLYATYLTWTIIHDTVYAFQDIHDDKKLGLKSMAVRTLRRTKPILSLLCTLQVLLLAGTAMLMHVNPLSDTDSWPRIRTLGFTMEIFETQWPFIVFAVAGNAIVLPFLITKVDLNDPRNCGWWFKTSSTLIGSSIGMGFALQYVFNFLM